MIQSEYTSNEVMNFMMAQSKPQIPHPHDVTHIKRDNLLNPIIAKDTFGANWEPIHYFRRNPDGLDSRQ